jgi:hypothetical protein
MSDEELKVDMENQLVKARLHGLFPTPMMETHIGRSFYDEEIEAIDRLSKNSRMNVGNWISENQNVLEDENLLDLRHVCVNVLTNFVFQVYRPKNKVIPYITQSWINVTHPGQHHHKHNHPNSFLSGVLYIDVDETRDSINFYNDTYQQIRIASDDTNIFTAISVQTPIATGKILVFPSSLSHTVDTVETGKPRISIAFNSFLKGEIGDTVYPMALEL